MKSALFIQALFKDPSEKIGWGHGRARRNWNEDAPLQSVAKKSLRGFGAHADTQVSTILGGSFLTINHRKAG